MSEATNRPRNAAETQELIAEIEHRIDSAGFELMEQIGQLKADGSWVTMIWLDHTRDELDAIDQASRQLLTAIDSFRNKLG